MTTIAPKTKARESAKHNYNAMLEAYYHDLVLEQKAGAISVTTHRALETFLRELRELVAETNPSKLAKAA